MTEYDAYKSTLANLLRDDRHPVEVNNRLQEVEWSVGPRSPSRFGHYGKVLVFYAKNNLPKPPRVTNLTYSGSPHAKSRPPTPVELTAFSIAAEQDFPDHELTQKLNDFVRSQILEHLAELQFAAGELEFRGLI